MKKIMKKALSLMLALVMMLSLAPMTGYAAVGETETLVDSKFVELAKYESEVYEYTAEAWGYLTVTIEEATGWYVNIVGENGETCLDSVVDSSVKTAKYDLAPGQGCMVSLMTQDAETYAAGTITYTVAFTETEEPEVGSALNPVSLEGASTSVTVEAGTEKYFVCAPAEANTYKLTVSGSENAEFGLVVPGKRGGTQTISAVNGQATSTFDINRWGSSSFAFSVSNTSSSDLSLTITYAVMTGTYNNPEILNSLGDAVAPIAGNQYFYKWTAPSNGVFRVSISQEAFDAYATGQVYEIETADGGWSYPDMPTTNVHAVNVAAGDVCIIQIGGGDAELAFTTSFNPGEVLETEEDDDANVPSDGEIIEGGEDYAESTATFIVGNNTVDVSNMYTYTVFTYEPTEIGKYTFTSEDSLMGIVSYNKYLGVTTNPSVESVASNTFTWDCTSVGQHIMIAVAAQTNVANINISRDDVEIITIPEYSVYASAEPYVYTGETSTLTYVNVEATDKVVDKAVYASDGYYHLNSVDGPVLMVNIYDELFSIANAPSTGKVVITSYDDEGKPVVKEVWNEVLLAYAACADKETGLYPLTPELVYFYQAYGSQQGLYAEDGYVGGRFKNGMGEDAWMFACMYVPNKSDGTIVLPPVVINPIEKDTEGKVTNTVATEETVKNIIEQAKEEGKDVVIQTTVSGLTITIANEDLADATAMKVDVKVEIKADVKDEAVAKNDKITKDNFVMKIEFAHEGKLPAEATIVIPVPAEVAKAYKTLYYYQIMEDGSLKYVCDAPINSDGKAVVTQDHCSDYVLLTEKVDAPLAEEIVAPKTGDSTNYALWLAVLGLGVVAMAGSVVMKKREF